MSRLTKKNKRKLRQDGIIDQEGNIRQQVFHVNPDIQPLTPGQTAAEESWQEGYNMVLHGSAGTGKSFLGLYFALSDIVDKKSERNKVYVVRSTVPTRDQGFQPGTKAEKEAVYESPYPPICNQIFARGDAYSVLKQKNMIEFTSTSFLRSVTWNNAYIVVDEAQNMSFHELDTIMTRGGKNCRYIFCGDTKQDDLGTHKKSDRSGLADFMKILDQMQEFDFVQFYPEDIVRSGLVKAYLTKKEQLGY
jgi:phosphate starvation-inducible PhoH-like protein